MLCGQRRPLMIARHGDQHGEETRPCDDKIHDGSLDLDPMDIWLAKPHPPTAHRLIAIVYTPHCWHITLTIHHTFTLNAYRLLQPSPPHVQHTHLFESAPSNDCCLMTFPSDVAFFFPAHRIFHLIHTLLWHKCALDCYFGFYILHIWFIIRFALVLAGSLWSLKLLRGSSPYYVLNRLRWRWVKDELFPLFHTYILVRLYDTCNAM